MGVNFGGFNVGMAHQFLNHPDVNAVFQQMRGKRMAKGMTTDALGDAGFIHGRLYRFLEAGFKNDQYGLFPYSPDGSGRHEILYTGGSSRNRSVQCDRHNDDSAGPVAPGPSVLISDAVEFS